LSLWMEAASSMPHRQHPPRFQIIPSTFSWTGTFFLYPGEPRVPVPTWGLWRGRPWPTPRASRLERSGSTGDQYARSMLMRPTVPAASADRHDQLRGRNYQGDRFTCPDDAYIAEREYLSQVRADLIRGFGIIASSRKVTSPRLESTKQSAPPLATG